MSNRTARGLRRAWLAALSAIPAACFGVPTAPSVTAVPLPDTASVSTTTARTTLVSSPTTTATTAPTSVAQAAGTLFALSFSGAPVGTILKAGAPPMTGDAAADLISRIVVANGGSIKVAASPDTAAGTLYKLPAWVDPATGPQPLAAVSISNSTTTDALAVGKSSFSWQAEFSQDKNTGTDAKDGDNVFQRGLATGPQWKLQADHLKVSCAIRGYDTPTSTALKVVTAPSYDIKAGVMYRVRCTRDVVTSTLAYLTMEVWRFNGAHWVAVATRTSTANALLDLRFAATVPVSIGGKLSTPIKFDSVADQLNGRVDNVSFSIID